MQKNNDRAVRTSQTGWSVAEIFKENLLGGKTTYIISQSIVIVYFPGVGALTRCILDYFFFVGEYI